MITLYAFGPMWGLPDPSPFVIKTQVQLKMADLPYAFEHAGPAQAPKGKLPFIVDDGETVADSTFIRDHLERKYGLDFDADLTAIQRAQAWALERMLEDHLYWAIVNSRWADDANFALGPAEFFAGAPEGVREGGRQRVIQNLHGQGFGRHRVEEVGDLAGRSCSERPPAASTPRPSPWSPRPWSPASPRRCGTPPSPSPTWWPIGIA
jgi:hypothetical protein